MEGDRFGNWMTEDLSLDTVHLHVYTFGKEFIHGFLSLGVVLCCQ